jgi:hypothetical protein
MHGAKLAITSIDARDANLRLGTSQLPAGATLTLMRTLASLALRVFFNHSAGILAMEAEIIPMRLACGFSVNAD